MHNRISIFSRYPALMAAMVLGGCTLKPPSTDEMLSTMVVAHPQSESTPSLLLTNNGFCVGIARQQAVTQVCTDKDAQPLEWDLGELKLQQTCLQAKNSNELMLAPCDGHAQWVWQEDKLFNSKVSRCLDVAGRRHFANTPLRLADCYGGANQSFLVGGIE